MPQEEERGSDDDSDEEQQESALDLMQKVMNESVSKKRGQKPLFSIFFEFLKIQYSTNFSFIAFLEGEGDDEHLRLVGAYGEESTSHLANIKLYKRDMSEGDELLWECLATTEAVVVEDGSVMSIVSDEMLVPFLLTAVTKPGIGEDKPSGIAVVGIALPQLAISEHEDPEGQSEGIAKSSIAKSSAVGEEEDEEEVQRREMIEFIKSGASVLGLNLIQTWRQLDEPRVHRLQLATSKMIDACVTNIKSVAQGTKELAKQVGAHVCTAISAGMDDNATSVLIGVLDDNHDKVWLTSVVGPEINEGAEVNPLPLGLDFQLGGINEKDLVSKAIKSGDVIHTGKCGEEQVFGSLAGDASKEGRACLVVPLVVAPEATESEQDDDPSKKYRGFCVGVMVLVRQNKEIPAGHDNSMDADIPVGFSSDEQAIAKSLQNPLASGIHSVKVRESLEHILQGLIRKYASPKGAEMSGEGAGVVHFQGPASLTFRRQIGATMVDASIDSSRLASIETLLEANAPPIKPDLGPNQPSISLCFFDQRKGTESQRVADEITAVATLAIANASNPNHHSSLGFQSKARICRNWMLTAEAILTYQCLQLGGLTEQEVLDLEPRLEPEECDRLVLTAVLTLLNELTTAEIALWKKCRRNLGATFFQQVVDFAPTASSVSQEAVSSAIVLYKQALPLKAEMKTATAALCDWLGAVFWVRKEMRACAELVRQTNLGDLNSMIVGGDFERVRTLIEVDGFHGAGTDETGFSPLHVISTIQSESHESWEGVRQMIMSMDNMKLMLHEKDARGKTPLHVAVQQGPDFIIRALVEAKAGLNSFDQDNHTPLMHAVVRKDMGTIAMILAAGADANVVTPAGTALDVAADWPDAQDVLRQHSAMTAAAIKAIEMKAKGDLEDDEEILGPGGEAGINLDEEMEEGYDMEDDMDM